MKSSIAGRRRARRTGGRPPSAYRDIDADPSPDDAASVSPGEMHIAVIGIDRYRHWDPLRNAVSDARGARDTFVKLGFKQVGRPLLDGLATSEALRRLVTDDLRRLDQNDSLILFFAGHGYTDKTVFPDGDVSRRGFILPIDAAPKRNESWLSLREWLSDVAHLPPKHILVILDSCHSGIALDHAAIAGSGMAHGEGTASRDARKSRQIITSALHDQRALDTGPREGHSLFTGCLLDGLAGDVCAHSKQRKVTGVDLWSYVKRRIEAQPDADQTPGFGVLELHNGGELVVRLPEPEPEPEPKPSKKPGRKAGGRRPKGPPQQPVSPPEPTFEGEEGLIDDPHPQDDGEILDPKFVAAIERHAAERSRGERVLSVVAGETTVALAGWAAWAARHGYLTLKTEGASLDAAIAELLAQIPWLRCVTAARASLAGAAERDPAEIDALLDARSGWERKAWIHNVAALDRHAQVSGWLLSGLREARARVPDLSTAPVQGAELLSIACQLAAPVSVLVHHPAPTVLWLERAIRAAAALVSYLPEHAVAVGAPAELVSAVLDSGRQSSALSMARQGVVPIEARAQGSAVRARIRAARALHDALARDGRTAGYFALDVEVPLELGGPTVEVDLVAESARLAIEIDGWYHFRDPDGYRDARLTDMRLQRAGYFVIRFLAEDVGGRLSSIVDEVAATLRSRRASSAFHGERL